MWEDATSKRFEGLFEPRTGFEVLFKLLKASSFSKLASRSSFEETSGLRPWTSTHLHMESEGAFSPYRNSSSPNESPRFAFVLSPTFRSGFEVRTGFEPRTSKPFHGLPDCHAWFRLTSLIMSRPFRTTSDITLSRQAMSLVFLLVPRLDSASKLVQTQFLVFLLAI